MSDIEVGDMIKMSVRADISFEVPTETNGGDPEKIARATKEWMLEDFASNLRDLIIDNTYDGDVDVTPISIEVTKP